MQHLNPSFKNLDSPPQILQLVIIPKYILIHFLIFKHPISIITQRVTLSIIPIEATTGSGS
ncbi:hypothetical protein Hanom_Chr15g01396881 [Helianthus anomalus]